MMTKNIRSVIAKKLQQKDLFEDSNARMRIAARNLARQRFDEAKQSIENLFKESSRWRTVSERQYQEVFLLSEIFQTPRQEENNRISLYSAISQYCRLRITAVSADDGIDLEFISQEEIYNLKEVVKKILSAMKERCEREGVLVSTREVDCPNRLLDVLRIYNLLRKICNALSTVARALRKLKGQINYRSREEHCHLIEKKFEQISTQSRRITINIISSSIEKFISTEISTCAKHLFSGVGGFSLALAQSSVLKRIGKSPLSDIFLSPSPNPFRNFGRKKRFNNQEFYNLAVNYGQWHALKEVEDKDAIFGGFPCQNMEEKIGCLSRAVIDDMVTIEKIKLLRSDLKAFEEKQAEDQDLASLVSSSTQFSEQRNALFRCLFLSMACSVKDEGFVAAVYNGLKKLKKHFKLFKSLFFNDGASDYLVNQAIDNLSILFETGKRWFQKAKESVFCARNVKWELKGLSKFFPKTGKEEAFRLYLQKIHDMAEYLFNQNYVASRYGVAFS